MNEEIETQFGLSLVDLVQQYQDKLSPAQVAHHMILNGVTISLSCSCNELDGIKGVLKFVQDAIAYYEENHS